MSPELFKNLKEEMASSLMALLSKNEAIISKIYQEDGMADIKVGYRFYPKMQSLELNTSIGFCQSFESRNTSLVEDPRQYKMNL